MLRGEEGRIIELTESPVTLGRGADNTVSVDADGVSRRHARLYAEQGRWGIRDLGSTNGVLVNDTSTREAWLNHGDIVMLGKLPYRFVQEADDTQTDSLRGRRGERQAAPRDDELPGVFAGTERQATGKGSTGTGEQGLGERAAGKGSPSSRPGPRCATKVRCRRGWRVPGSPAITSVQRSG